MNIIIFLAVLIVLILVHEFGHFIVAKRSGIRVDEFGIGFPPKLFGKKYGETEYSINALPFGGFVRIFGEDPQEVLSESEESTRALVHKPRLVQAAVMFSGVFFNVLLAWALFSGALMVGTPALEGNNDKYLAGKQLMVTQVLPGSPAESAGLTLGDTIISLETSSRSILVNIPTDIAAFVENSSGEEVRFTIERDGVQRQIPLRPKRGILDDEPERTAVGLGTAIIGTLTLPPHLAILEGGRQTAELLYRITIGIGAFIKDALFLRADFGTIAGPVGIVSLVGEASALGIVALLNFTALISLNLAVINLIPFPALDGGRLLFLAIEGVKRTPIKPNVARAANAVGFALLILLMLAVTYQDILRLVH